MASQLDLLRYLAKIDRKVGILFDKFHEELAKSGLSFEDLPKDKIFSFDRYPEAARRAQEAAKKLRTSLSSLIIGGVRGVVTMAFLQQKEAFGDKTKYTPKVLDDFRERTVQSFIDNRLNTKEGLDLSTCVWNYAEQSKAEFELGLSQVLEDGIRKGESAEEIGRKVRHKLNDPDMMWRRYHVKEIKSDGTKVDKVEWRKRVIDEDGKVRFVKQPLDHPGVGVYRSARKNAKRMAANEINMAHKYADIVRYQNEPFILGFHIGLSGHRSDVVENFHDMCDDLVGDYPKWFFWALWHVNCKCVVTAILCSKEEMRKIQSLPEAEYRAYRSPNLIKDMPDCYDNYMALNEDRIARSVDRGTQPYWIRDNYVDGDPSKGFVDHSTPIVEAIPEKTPEERHAAIKEAARNRHEKRDYKGIQRSWDIRYINNWQWEKPRFETDPSSFDDDYLRQNLNRVAVCTGSGVYSEETIKKANRSWLLNTWKVESSTANIIIRQEESKVNISLSLFQNLANDKNIPTSVISQIRKYLNNMNNFESWNYTQRLRNNMAAVINLKELIKKNVDFSKISANMPMELLPDSVFYPMKGTILDKRLFDNIDYYVPVNIVDSGTGSHNPFSLSVKLNSKSRRGDYHFIENIYHEYGHALDASHNHYIQPEVDELMREFDREFKKVVDGSSVKNTTYYELLDYSLGNDFWKAYSDKDLKEMEQIASMMDIVQSLSKGKYGRKDIDGHSKRGYWTGKDGKRHVHTEFVAHMSECFFLGNSYVRKKNADLYEKMVALFSKLFIKK